MNLLLMIKNPSALEKGTLPSHVFTQDGGTVGSSHGCSWYLDNYIGTISSVVFTIELINGDFCLFAKDSSIYINNSHQPLMLGTVVRLKSGDTIQLHDYLIDTRIINESDDFMTYEMELCDILGIKESLLLTGKAVPLTAKPVLTPHKLLTLQNDDILTDPLLLLNNNSPIKSEVMDYYDSLGIIPKINLNESLQPADSQDISRTDRFTVPMFLPKVQESKLNVLDTKPPSPKQEEKVKLEVTKEILDPLLLLNPPVIKD